MAKISDFDFLPLGADCDKKEGRNDLDADVIIIGAGGVGAALAYGNGAERQAASLFWTSGARPACARANFGLVWFRARVRRARL